MSRSTHVTRNVTKVDPGLPDRLPVYPAGSVSGRQARPAPLYWLDAEGRRHATRES